MTDMERDLREMMQRTADGVHYVPQPSRGLVRRARVARARTAVGTGMVALALVVGGFAVRSAVSTDAAPVPPAEDPLKPRQGVEVITGSLEMVDPVTGRSRSLGDDAKVPGTIGNAAWSPSGGWVAYDMAGRKESLWVVGAQGEPRQLAEVAGAWAWSPTDAQLAMMRTPSSLFPEEAEGRVPLILLDASTGRETDLGTTVGEVTTGPVWSPDGTRIVYGVRGGSIYSVDVESGDHALLVRLQGNLDSIYGLEWSPDGAHMAILVDVAEDRRRLYVMDADASELPTLVDDLEAWGWWSFPGDPLTQIAWSPDGTRLTYPTFSGPDQRELRIWTASLDGSAPSLVASRLNDECCIDGGSPVWSPDGSHIAFETDEMYLAVNADGTGQPREIDRLTYLNWRGGWYFCYCYG
jgi:Tol biopolymer transport system component